VEKQGKKKRPGVGVNESRQVCRKEGEKKSGRSTVEVTKARAAVQTKRREESVGRDWHKENRQTAVRMKNK
jgi:hypothetical protein